MTPVTWLSGSVPSWQQQFCLMQPAGCLSNLFSTCTHFCFEYLGDGFSTFRLNDLIVLSLDHAD